MQTIDIGRAFFHFIRVRPETPYFHKATTVEISEPFRRSDSLIVVIPFTNYAIVLGWWEETGWDPETALMEAVRGWGIDPYDDRMGHPEVRQSIREHIATQGLDPCDEWKVISVLDVID